MKSAAASRNGIRAASAQDDGSRRVRVRQSGAPGHAPINRFFGDRHGRRQTGFARWQDGRQGRNADIVARLHVVAAFRAILAVAHIVVEGGKCHRRIHAGGIRGMHDRARREHGEHEDR